MTQDLAGRRIVLTAQRRAEEFAGALERRGAEVIHAPTMSHVPHVDDAELNARTRELVDKKPDLVVVTTAIGFRGWLEAAEAAGQREALVEALAGARILTRGPKARGAVQGAGLEVSWSAESETADEVKLHLATLDLRGTRVAVQHHGAGSDGIDEQLRDSGADVVSLVVYRWGPAPDPRAVERAVHLVARGEVDAIAFTAAPGADAFFTAAHLAGVRDEVVAALREGRVRATAVGDTTAAPLRAYGIEPLVPERFRLGALVKLVIAELGRDAS
ncbi:uroporphyrinogen-III synthase [Dermacoccus abyssi]|uniref:Uroporphyrinogen-III synthase n=1 Tax=Dermacoccus abyssi TaxID=322596 RepID=A0ABX5Z738_9MICO|nr:uroporphyrinogen-III synthase [Dermacoccus abyssi]